MPAKVHVFASPRGGIGKSTLTSQIAAAFACTYPLKEVLLLDLSIHGDSSSALIGGSQAPSGNQLGIATKFQEMMTTLPPTKRSSAFLKDVSAAPAAVSQQAGGWFFRGAASVAPTVNISHVKWKDYALNVRTTWPTGNAPTNLFVMPGDVDLNRQFETPAAMVACAKNVRSLFDSLGDDVVVFVDTDAELSERCASIIGLSVATDIHVVTSSLWPDYQRILSDRVNGKGGEPAPLSPP